MKLLKDTHYPLLLEDTLYPGSKCRYELCKQRAAVVALRMKQSSPTPQSTTVEGKGVCVSSTVGWPQIGREKCAYPGCRGKSNQPCGFPEVVAGGP